MVSLLKIHGSRYSLIRISFQHPLLQECPCTLQIDNYFFPLLMDPNRLGADLIVHHLYSSITLKLRYHERQEEGFPKIRGKEKNR